MFDQVNYIISNYTSTVLFYILICVLVVSLGFISDYCHIFIRVSKNHRINVFLLISLCVMWFIIAFSTCGADYYSYSSIFTRATQDTYWKETDIEVGYMTLNYIVRLFTSDFTIFRVIWASLYVGIFYYSIKKYSNYLINYLAILAFACMFLFQPMNLMRIYLAAIILLWGFDYLLKREYIKSIVIVLLCSTIHISSIIMLFPIVFVFFAHKNGHYFIKALFIIAVIVFVFLERQELFSLLMPSKYLIRYFVREDVILGFSKIAYFIPLIVPFYFIKKKRLLESDDRNENTILFSYTLICIAIGFMSSIVEGISRTFCYFMPVYIIIPSYFINLLKNSRMLSLSARKRYILITQVFCILYLVFRGIFMLEYLETDMLTPYTNIFGVSI